LNIQYKAQRITQPIAALQGKAGLEYFDSEASLRQKTLKALQNRRVVVYDQY